MAEFLILGRPEQGIKVLEILKKVLENQKLREEVAAGGETFDLGPAIDLAFPDTTYLPDDSHHAEPEVEDIDDEDLRLIVQTRVEDQKCTPVLQTWVDTNITPEELDAYRRQWPEHEYRLVAVYDEIVDELDSVDQQEVSPEDEIGLLKAEVLKLKAQIAQYEQDDNAQ